MEWGYYGAADEDAVNNYGPVGHISWTDVVLHDWTDYSGEFGHRASHVRRVRLTPVRSGRYALDGLIRVSAFGPEDDWTEYEWETFDYRQAKGA